MAVKKKAKKNKNECGPCAQGCGCSGAPGKSAAVYHGLYASMDPETGIFTEANYDNGTLNGEYTEYYDMDAEIIKTRGRYQDGKKEGQWISYGKDGKAVKVESYKHGKKSK